MTKKQKTKNKKQNKTNVLYAYQTVNQRHVPKSSTGKTKRQDR